MASTLFSFYLLSLSLIKGLSFSTDKLALGKEFSELNEVVEPALLIWCRKLSNIEDVCISSQIKSIFFSHKMFKAFIFISHFLDLYREKEKVAKIAIFFVTNFQSISSFAFTFQRSFCEKPLLKTKLRHLLFITSCVYSEAVLW